MRHVRSLVIAVLAFTPGLALATPATKSEPPKVTPPTQKSDDATGKVTHLAGKTWCFGAVDKGVKCDFEIPMHKKSAESFWRMLWHG